MVVLFWLHLFLQISLSFLDSFEEKTVNKNVAVFSVDDTEITLEVDGNINYVDVDGTEYNYDTTSIDKIKFEGSALEVKFEIDQYNSMAAVQCEFSNMVQEIEIRSCFSYILSDAIVDVVQFSFGYTIKLNRNTKYIFEDHEFVVQMGKQRLTLKIISLIITFSGYTQTYTWKRESTDPMILKLDSPDVISNFEEYGGELVSENFFDDSSKTDDTQEDESPDKDADKTDPQDDNIEDEFKNDPEDNTSEKRHWLKILLIVIGSSVMAVMIAVLLYVCIRSLAEILLSPKAKNSVE
ncbi:hypothetical protein RF11_09868 [Thelohanellus kitauei]|uniref:Uncharacterized protein n=1 Tax=Thelohanellus kitauei TaxID=669202 RepID=A0A0C2IUI0_THEKT|nr:hypothetical protein RF11_09868 [Thelohanellus kitauei]